MPLRNLEPRQAYIFLPGRESFHDFIEAMFKIMINRWASPIYEYSQPWKRINFIYKFHLISLFAQSTRLAVSWGFMHSIRSRGPWAFGHLNALAKRVNDSRDPFIPASPPSNIQIIKLHPPGNKHGRTRRSVHNVWKPRIVRLH